MDDQSRPVGATDVVIRPRGFDVGLVVEPFEPVERVPRLERLAERRKPKLFHRSGTEAEEPVEESEERRFASGDFDTAGHVVQQAERVVPPPALVEGRVDQQAGVAIEGVLPPRRKCVELACQFVVVDGPGHLGGAVVAVGEVECVTDRVGDSLGQEVLAVTPTQIGGEVDERPFPVEIDSGRQGVGEEGVGQRTRLTGEPICSSGHAVADRQVSFLAADLEQCVEQLLGPFGGDRQQQRKLRLVDVPHRADVEDERPIGRPERALVLGEARLQQRVIERRVENGSLIDRSTLDRDGAECRRPRRCGRRTALIEAGRCAAGSDRRPSVGRSIEIGAKIRLGLLDTAE